MSRRPFLSVLCPGCGGLRTVNEQRKIRPHGPKKKPCIGSGLTAEETRKLWQEQHDSAMKRSAEVIQSARRAAEELERLSEVDEP